MRQYRPSPAGIGNFRNQSFEDVENDDDDEIQDIILSLHYICIQTLNHRLAFKIIENHIGVAFINQLQMASNMNLIGLGEYTHRYFCTISKINLFSVAIFVKSALV